MPFIYACLTILPLLTFFQQSFLKLSWYTSGAGIKGNNTMKIVNDIEDLKALSDKYTSPCAKCDTTEGCPAPVNCKVYNDWKKKLHEEMGGKILQGH